MENGQRKCSFEKQYVLFLLSVEHKENRFIIQYYLFQLPEKKATGIMLNQVSSFMFTSVVF